MSGVLQDLRFALRSLRRSSGFALTALLTLACGIGLTAGMFGVVRQTLLAPLPYARADRLVALDFGFTGEGAAGRQVGGAADFLARYSRSFSSLGVADGGNSAVNLADAGAGSGHATPVQQLRISRGFLPALGITPALGRLFTAEEDLPGGPRAALLSDAAWRSRFHADPAILGRTLRIDGEDTPVVGLLPADAVADLQGGTRETEPASLYQPLQLSPKDPGFDGTNYQMIGRLRDGVSLAEARQELHTLLPAFARQTPWYTQWRLRSGELGQLRAFPLQAALTGDVRTSIMALLGAAVAVLLVACLNLTGLMIARTSARSRELAVRSALGASRTAMVRLLLAEAVVLAATGSLFGLLVAHLVSSLFLAFAPLQLPHWAGPSPVWVMAACTAVLATTATVLSGLLPMAVVFRREVNQGLRTGGTQGRSTGYQRTGRALIVAQVTLAFVLLAAASLLLHLFLTMHATAPGFDTAQVTIGQVTLKGDGYTSTAHSARLLHGVLDRLSHTPGIERAGAVNGLPLDRGLNTSGWPDGRKDLRQNLEVRFTGGDYMAAIGIPLLQGRGIRGTDTEHAPKVAVVNQTAARKWWPNGDAIGSRIQVGSDDAYLVVGIARDTHERSLLDAPRVLIYLAQAQISDKLNEAINGWFPTTFVVRTHAGVDVAAAMASAVSAADPELPLNRVETMQSVVNRTVETPRFFSWLSSSFAVLTLLLAAVGLFGLLSFQVTQRTREIGVRMALGATRGRVLGSILLRGVVVTATGLLLGALLSLALPGLLSGMLQEFAVLQASTHPLTSSLQAAATAALLLLAVTAVASLLPALRASAVEPVTALRAE